MIFSSDNWAGAHPSIAQSLVKHAGGYVPAYGASDLDKTVDATFSRIFERDVAVFFVGTGTAANSLAMATCYRPGGVAFCHSEAHMIVDECGSPEFLAGGIRLCPVAGALGKFGPDALSAAIGRYSARVVHSGQPMAVSITQATEVGTVYSLNEIEAVAGVAHAHGLPLHMDGARFANALVALETTPAEMTWKRGVDLVSFGGTKNGCWCAEALVVFDPAKAFEIPFLRKRSAHLFSKSRFIAAQFEAYFADDLWLTTARHANAMTRRLAEVISSSNRIRLAWTPDANEAFAVMPRALMEELNGQGARFYPWAKPASYDEPVAADETFCRFVTSFATREEDIDAFRRLLMSK